MKKIAASLVRTRSWVATVAVVIAAGFGGQAFAAGEVDNRSKLVVSGTPAGTTVLDASGLVPGASRAGSMTVANQGARPAHPRLGLVVEDVRGPLGGTLSEALLIEVVEVRSGHGRRTLWSGRLSDAPSIEAAALDPGRRSRFALRVTLPADAPNSVQGAASRIRFRWTG